MGGWGIKFSLNTSNLSESNLTTGGSNCHSLLTFNGVKLLRIAGQGTQFQLKIIYFY